MYCTSCGLSIGARDGLCGTLKWHRISFAIDSQLSNIRKREGLGQKKYVMGSGLGKVKRSERRLCQQKHEIGSGLNKFMTS